MKFKDYYKMLGVTKEAKLEEIRNNYRKIAKELHTDILNQKLKNKEITLNEYNYYIDKFKEISEAYNTLMCYKERKEYNKLYDEYQQQESLKRRKEEQRKRTYSNHSNKKRKKGLVNEFKQAYKEVKKDESRTPNFKQRHEFIDDDFFNENYDEDMNNLEFIEFQTKRGLIHVSLEFLFHLYKLRYLKKDSIYKIIVRNRRLEALLMAGIISFNVGSIINNKISEPTNNNIVAEKTITDEDIEYYSIIDMNRYYIIKGGDTLSAIAKETGTSQSAIQRVNNISEPNYIIMGKEIIIPYEIKSDDLEYYTDSAKYDNKISLEEFATKYRTDVRTLKNLNKEAIQEHNGAYVVLSDSLKVPNFISKEELEEKKEKQY